VVATRGNKMCGCSAASPPDKVRDHFKLYQTLTQARAWRG